MTGIYHISDEQRADFAAHGHILLRGVANRGEIDAFRPAIKNGVRIFSSETRGLEERDTYGKAFLQITNVWERDEKVREFVFAKRFAQIAADLLGVEKVRLYHDQALFKEPGGGHTPWHQDQYYWPLDTTNTITMWMPLVDIVEDMGIMTFASGSHAAGDIGSTEISDASETIYKAYIAENGYPTAGAETMLAGDATFHAGWTIHSAGPNLSATTTREVMTIIYFADGARVTPPANEHQMADLEAWLGGRKPGDVADGPLNPVLNQ